MASQTSVSTLAGDDPSEHDATSTLAFGSLPTIFVIPAHLSLSELHTIEDQLRCGDAPLTYDPQEARLFLGKITQKRRAVMELRSRGVLSEEVGAEVGSLEDGNGRPAKRKRREESENGGRMRITEYGSSTESESDVSPRKRKIGKSHAGTFESVEEQQDQFQCLSDVDTIGVLRLAWLEESLKDGTLLPLKDYLVYLGKRSQSHTTQQASIGFSQSDITHARPPATTPAPDRQKVTTNSGLDILERAKADAPTLQTGQPRSFASTSQHIKRAHAAGAGRIAHLIHQTTSEHDLGQSQDLPEMPDWVMRQSNFSCDRVTLLHGPNDAFVEELKKIRLARTLIADDIGVRAYSTSIAAIAAYPYTVMDQREILALPGCDTKISALWVEWKNKDGFIQAVHDAETSEELKVMRLFYDIWGVGAQTARDFYGKGWRDLDDIVEYGWNELSRVQQIGVKYYDEFLDKLSRAEVEFIGSKVHEHAQRVREPTGVRTCIVGGHRRGKKESGDVDIIVSHLEEDETLGIIEDIVKSLQDEGWITHELITHTSATRRSQSTLPYRSGGGGHGFDTLDKALVVWQDPNWPGRGKGGDPEAERKKNPNIHRRVDIIIAPWSKIGCAVLGWTAGTTFERDLRRYARKVKGWKFDSSGVRDRNTGVEVDLESVGGRCTSVDEAERKVFAGFGLEWREPWERNTG